MSVSCAHGLGSRKPARCDLYRRPDFRDARYAALVTGPSATADIEGVLIRGAQGVRSLTVVWLAPD
jgi:L-lactate dehydrogenase complex protein LldG